MNSLALDSASDIELEGRCTAYESCSAIVGTSSTDDDCPIERLQLDILSVVMQHTTLRDWPNCLAVSKTFQTAVSVWLARRPFVQAVPGSLTTAGVPSFGRFVARYCRRLQILSLRLAAPKEHPEPATVDLAALGLNCSQLVNVTLLNVRIGDGALTSLASRAPALRQLAIGYLQGCWDTAMVQNLPSFTDEGVTAIVSGCPALSSLSLFGGMAGDDTLAEMGRRGLGLASLTLHNCSKVTKMGVVALVEGCPALQKLDILTPEGSGVPATLDFASMFALAANCSGLQELRVSEELQRLAVLDSASLALVAEGCRSLRVLDMAQVEVADSMLIRLADNCPELRELRLEQTYVGDDGIEAVVRGCQHLQELRIAGWSQHAWLLPSELMFPGISEDGLLAISRHCTALTHLHISGMGCDSDDGFTPQPLLSPGFCRQLTWLGLDWLKPHSRLALGTRQLAALVQGAPLLRGLSLVGYQGDMDEVLEHISTTPGATLQELDISHSSVTDAGLATVGAGFSQLLTLSLGFCRNTSPCGLLALSQLRRLERLNMWGSEKWSDAVIAELVSRSRSLQSLHVNLAAGPAAAADTRRHAANPALQLDCCPPPRQCQFQLRTLQQLQC